jgi:hypothetical protein
VQVGSSYFPSLHSTISCPNYFFRPSLALFSFFVYFFRSNGFIPLLFAFGPLCPIRTARDLHQPPLLPSCSLLWGSRPLSWGSLLTSLCNCSSSIKLRFAQTRSSSESFPRKRECGSFKTLFSLRFVSTLFDVICQSLSSMLALLLFNIAGSIDHSTTTRSHSHTPFLSSAKLNLCSHTPCTLLLAPRFPLSLGPRRLIAPLSPSYLSHPSMDSCNNLILYQAPFANKSIPTSRLLFSSLRHPQPLVSAPTYFASTNTPLDTPPVPGDLHPTRLDSIPYTSWIPLHDRDSYPSFRMPYGNLDPCPFAYPFLHSSRPFLKVDEEQNGARRRLRRRWASIFRRRKKKPIREDDENFTMNVTTPFHHPPFFFSPLLFYYRPLFYSLPNSFRVALRNSPCP